MSIIPFSGVLKAVKARRLRLAGAGLMLVAASLSAEDAVRYKSFPIGNKVVIAGTSTIHDWTMEGALINGFFDIPAAVEIDSAKAALAGSVDGEVKAQADVVIRVNTIHNAEFEGMSEVYLQAMKAADYPEISFHLSELKLKPGHAAGAPFEFDAKGNLVVAGVTNAIAMPVRIETVDKAKLKISGSVPLKMTSFGLKPPVKAGIFAAGDDIKISFDWVVKLLPAKKP